MSKSLDKKTNERLEIRPHQVAHFNKLMVILQNHYGYVDVSTPGTGKTILGLAVAAAYDFDLFVICNKGGVSKWETEGKKYGLNILQILTYQTLRGTKKDLPSHGYLIRHVHQPPTPPKSKKIPKPVSTFTVTPKFSNCVKKGILLIFDEYQYVKNKNSQLLAGHALVNEVVRLAKEGFISRIGLLSGTPFCKKEHAASTLKMLGIITQTELSEYNPSTHVHKLVGMKEAMEYCHRLDPDETADLNCRSVNRNSINEICFNLCVKVVFPNCASAMPPVTGKVDAKNGYYIMPETDLEQLRQGVHMLASAASYRTSPSPTTSTSTTVKRRGKWGDTTPALMMIEGAKVNTVIRLAQLELEREANRKVIIYFSYLGNMDRARQGLAKYNPLYTDGHTSMRERDVVHAKFQQSDNKHRLLISNMKVGGVSVDLDDIDGDYPRTILMIPTFHYIDSVQATGRTNRENTKSESTIRFVYSREHPNETSILDAISKKNLVVRSVILDHNHVTLLPGEYQSEVEMINPETGERYMQSIDFDSLTHEIIIKEEKKVE